MSWRTYGNKGYPTYSNVPAQEGDYAHGPKHPSNWYVVETTTIERIRTPATRYMNYGDQEYNHGPSTLISPNHAPKEVISPNHPPKQIIPNHPPKELIGPNHPPKELIGPNHPPKELISPNHAPKDHRVGNEPDYESDNEKSSPPGDHGRGSFMNKFRNKLQIKTSQPMKTTTSPIHNHPSEEAHAIKTRNLTGPNNHQPTNPEHNYRPEEAHMIRNKSFSDPSKYKSSSPERRYPSEETHLIRPKNFPGPNKYQPSSPERSYPSEEAHLIRPKNFPGPNKYQPSSPKQNYPSEETYLARSRNFSGPNKYQPTSPVYNYPSDDDHLIRPGNFSGLDNHHPSLPGQFRHFSGPKNHWQSVGPPMTHHPLTSVTNDINEALGFLEESMNYSPHSGQLRTRPFDNFHPHPQSIEPEWQYARPTFSGPTNNFRTNIINSHEAIRKYQGTRVP
ncbi:hypothetical protein OSB04_018411 [Centaurea solstitialis]|uniref:Uncharacterized protein n=1 Tax=Centaurea solstitialis TaxID=347529 RepID=A0AA38TFP8_9ASTR|nr:hypothetical protein OSB04_018411 [Centaurea solstitialis]